MSVYEAGKKVLENALAALQIHGWGQGAYETNEGKFCLVGALRFVTGNGYADPIGHNEAIMALFKTVRPDVRFPDGEEYTVEPAMWDVISWNDSFDTTYEDVENAITRALVYCDSDHSRSSLIA